MFTLPHLFYIGFYLKWVSVERWHLVVALAIQFLTNNQPMAFSPVCLFFALSIHYFIVHILLLLPLKRVGYLMLS